MKIVINNQYGGFGLSSRAIEEYLKLKGEKAYFYNMEIEDREVIYTKIDSEQRGLFINCFTKDFGEKFTSEEVTNEEFENHGFNLRDISRADKDLIKIVEELKGEADGTCAALKIVEIPDDVEWQIEEYDGLEWVAEKHRTWR